MTSQNVKITSWLKMTAILDNPPYWISFIILRSNWTNESMFHSYVTLKETNFLQHYFPVYTNSGQYISQSNQSINRLYFKRGYMHKLCCFERKLENSQLWDLPFSLTWVTLGSHLVDNSRYKEMRYKPWCPVTVFLDQVYWEYHGWSRSPVHSFLFLLPVHEKLHKYPVN